MSTPYETEQTITTTGSNQIVAIPFPGRIFLDRVAVVKLGGGTVTITAFNRAFTGPATNIKQIIADSTGDFCNLQFKLPFAVKIGDVITVTNSGISGYNTTHRVTGLPDGGNNLNIVTDQAYVGYDTGNTITGQLTIPSGEQSMYTVLTATGTGNAVVTPEMPYVNLDPLLNVNRGINRFIYINFATADTYKLAIRGRDSIGLAGN